MSVYYQVPKAPGYQLREQSKDFERQEYSERFRELEEILNSIIHDLPFTNDDDIHLATDYHRDEGYQYVRKMFRDQVVWEFIFLPDGSVELLLDGEPGPSREKDGFEDWHDGVQALVIHLEDEAKTEKENAERRIQELGRILIREGH